MIEVGELHENGTALTVAAVQLDQVKSVQHGNVTGTSTAQRLEIGEPVRGRLPRPRRQW
jgi:hypothetical protein